MPHLTGTPQLASSCESKSSPRLAELRGAPASLIARTWSRQDCRRFRTVLAIAGWLRWMTRPKEAVPTRVRDYGRGVAVGMAFTPRCRDDFAGVRPLTSDRGSVEMRAAESVN